jgi:hypothetical protein
MITRREQGSIVLVEIKIEQIGVLRFDPENPNPSTMAVACRKGEEERRGREIRAE